MSHPSPKHSPGRAILDGRVNFPACLAPMVGLSHVAFRRLLREYLPANATTLWSTEMLNSRRLPGENLKTTPETMRHESETELVPQILGNEAEAIAHSCARLENEWGASGIDINMGCPVKKALAHNYGVALMGDAAYAAEVVRMTVRSTSLPVSVKLRAGHQNDLSYLLRFVSGLQDAGASWITLHPRTTEQKRRGSADWSQIRVVRESLSIPVIGNGDVQTVDDVLSLRESTGCDLVMIGRALTARPWLLWQLGERLGFEAPVAAADARGGASVVDDGAVLGGVGIGAHVRRAPVGPVEEGAEYGRSLRRLLALMQEHFTEELGLRKFRFYVKTGAPWLLFGHDLHARTTKARTWVEMDSMLEDFFSCEQPMSVRTELRQ